MWSADNSPNLKLALRTPRRAASIRFAVAGANFAASFDRIAVVCAKSSAHQGGSSRSRPRRPAPQWFEGVCCVYGIPVRGPRGDRHRVAVEGEGTLGDGASVSAGAVVRFSRKQSRTHYAHPGGKDQLSDLAARLVGGKKTRRSTAA